MNLNGFTVLACENEMADGKEKGEGEEKFHKFKVGGKTGGVIWQTFGPEVSGEAGLEHVPTFPRTWE